jgi:hypothetical protein
MADETVEQRDARLALEATEAALRIELASMEARSDSTGKRRADEIRGVLGLKRTAAKGETRLRGAAAEKRGAE